MKIFQIAYACAFFMAAGALGGIAISQHAHHGTGAAEMKAPTNAKEAFEAANDKMHKDMSISFTGNTDVDFVRGMIPHHQGAIDMANVLLKYGKDPELRKLAEAIIKAQESEISWMKEWLAKNTK